MWIKIKEYENGKFLNHIRVVQSEIFFKNQSKNVEGIIHWMTDNEMNIDKYIYIT